MPATDYQWVSSFTGFGRPSRDQVHSMETAHGAETSQEHQLEAFQIKVAQRLNDLSSANSDGILSIPWIQKLLDVFLCCQEDFKSILVSYKGFLNRAPLDRYVSEYFERSVKALDVCNAVRDGLEQMKQWQKQLEIVLCALGNQRCLGEGQFRRAKKILIDLAIGMLDEKVVSRNRSFEKIKNSKGHFRSLSWSVSRNWSAARQLQAIGSNLAAPKSNGLALAVFTMSYLLYFVMWALVAAIPCQDRGLHSHFNPVLKFGWAGPLLSLHERILEESKRRDCKNSRGLLKEIREVEKSTRELYELSNSIVEFPLCVEKEGEVKQRVIELGLVFDSLKVGLEPLERQVREVFHGIVRCRIDFLS